MTVVTAWVWSIVAVFIFEVDGLLSQEEDHGCATVDDTLLLQMRASRRTVASRPDAAPASSPGGVVFLARPQVGGTEGSLAVLDEPGAVRQLLAHAEPKGLAVDASARKIYWCQPASGSIMRADLDGTDAEEVVGGRPKPQRLALDLPGRNLYWSEGASSDGSGGALWRADLDGSNAQAVLPAPSFSSAGFIAVSSPLSRDEGRPIEMTLDGCSETAPAHVTGLTLSPDPAVLGGITRLTFSVHLDKDVEVGNYTMNITGPLGFTWVTHTAQFCGESSFDISILSFYVGMITVHGPTCPVSAGTFAIDLDLELANLTLSSAIEASVVMAVADMHQEEVMCATLHLVLPAEAPPADAYWTTTQGSVLRTRTDGRGHTETLLALSNVSFGGLALDPGRGRLYLAEHQECAGSSEIVGYDYGIGPGLTNRNVVVHAGSRVTSIDVDRGANVLYWAGDGPNGTVSRIRLDQPSDREVLAHVGVGGAWGMVAMQLF